MSVTCELHAISLRIVNVILRTTENRIPQLCPLILRLQYGDKHSWCSSGRRSSIELEDWGD